MALTNKIEKTVELPHEPGEWIKVRMPSAFMSARASEMSLTDGTLFLLEKCVLAWSYPDLLTRENLEELDNETVIVIRNALFPSIDEEERKNA